MEQGLLLHPVKVAGTRIKAQETNRLSCGIYHEGVMASNSMLSHIDLAKSALMP
jgi:hypothetical protein